jgi:hypothetical protein
MPISKEDAQKLLQSKGITDETYNSIPAVMDPNQMSTDSPMIDASAVSGKEFASTAVPNVSVPGIIAGAVSGGVKPVVDAASNAAQFTNQQGVDAPVFENKLAGESQKNVNVQGKEAKTGVEKIAKEQEKTAAPVSNRATKAAQGTAAYGTSSADYINKQAAINDSILADSEKALSDLRSKIAINPNRLMEKISADGKGPMVTIALVLGGIGAGLTGQPNAAQAILEKRIQQDIDAQQTSIKNAFEQEGQIRALSKEVRASAGENVMAKAAAQSIVLTGYKAAIENVLQNVTDKTAIAKAQALILKLDEGILKSNLDYDNIHKANIKSGSSEASNLLGAGILGYTNNLGLNIGVPRQTMDTTGVRNQYGLGITQPTSNIRQVEQPKKETPKKEAPKEEKRSAAKAFIDGFTKQMFGAADK